MGTHSSGYENDPLGEVVSPLRSLIPFHQEIQVLQDGSLFYTIMKREYNFL
jgi:hypothetical protein